MSNDTRFDDAAQLSLKMTRWADNINFSGSFNSGHYPYRLKRTYYIALSKLALNNHISCISVIIIIFVNKYLNAVKVLRHVAFYAYAIRRRPENEVKSVYHRQKYGHVMRWA